MENKDAVIKEKLKKSVLVRAREDGLQVDEKRWVKIEDVLQ